jgi:hypothetical protein
LEHLENTFYLEALSQFSETDFLAAGFDSSFFVNLQFVAFDEQQHVLFLEQTIEEFGETPVSACQYNFGFNDVSSFVALASVLEGVGVSAYLGAAGFISSSEVLTAAAAITVSEGLHQAFQRASVLNVVSANIAGTPLSPSAILTIAETFIQSCPSSNFQLPFSSFASVSVSGGASAAVSVNAGSEMILVINGGSSVSIGSSVFVTFVNALQVISVSGTILSGNAVSATIPQEVQGQAFAMLTNAPANGSSVADSSVIAGPAIMEVSPQTPTLNFQIL